MFMSAPLLAAGLAATPDFKLIKKNANTTGLTADGVKMGGFTLDSNDLANLVKLGNAARRVKGAAELTFQTNVGSSGLGGASTTTTTGYQIASGGSVSGVNWWKYRSDYLETRATS